MTWASGAGTPGWVLLLCGVLGLGVGRLLAQRLGTREYRLDEETGHTGRLSPGWLTVATGMLWLALAWRFGPYARWALLPALLCFATIGLALAWIDLDVHRLPEGLTLPALPVLAGQLLLTAWAGHDWPALLRALVAGLVLGLVALLLAVVASAVGSGFGLGDVVLSALIGLVTGFVAWWTPVAAFYLAFLLGGGYAVWHVALRRRSARDAIPFGPFLVAGALVALFLELPAFG